MSSVKESASASCHQGSDGRGCCWVVYVWVNDMANTGKYTHWDADFPGNIGVRVRVGDCLLVYECLRAIIIWN